MSVSAPVFDMIKVGRYNRLLQLKSEQNLQLKEELARGTDCSVLRVVRDRRKMSAVDVRQVPVGPWSVGAGGQAQCML